MPWWGWTLIGLFAGGALVAPLAVLVVSNRTASDGRALREAAEKLATAEARIRALELKRQVAELEGESEAEADAVLEDGKKRAETLEGDAEAQVDGAMDFLT